MAKLTNSELQKKLDVQKWLDSEVKGADACGDYDYCAFCDKTEDMPCAKAYSKASKKAAAATTEPEAKKAPAKKPAAKKAPAKKK